ncbi:hypothetical protein MINTM021_25800 [Mycobacterium paraintracellulare]|nr:hypothetical protein MINTM021_25800 [Mycobacterium paraintracellulare]
MIHDDEQTAEWDGRSLPPAEWDDIPLPPQPSVDEELGDPPPDPETDAGDPLYADIAALLDGTLPEPPAPRLLTRTDSHAVFYAARVNILFGDPEVGKTWVAFAACVEALREVRRVLVIDLDHNGVEAVIANLLLLGAPRNLLRNQSAFRYCEPDDAAEVYRIVADCQDWRPAVAVVDSFGELLPMLGGSSNSDDEYTVANRAVLQPLANAGAAVIGIDHLAKNAISRAAGPTGTPAKRRAIGGASIRVQVARQLVPGHGGSAHLFINKDRHGGLRKHCPAANGNQREQLAGTFVMSRPDDHGCVRWYVAEPTTDANDVNAATDRPKAARIRAALTTTWMTARAVACAIGDTDDERVSPTEKAVESARYHLKKLAADEVIEQHPSGSQWRARPAETTPKFSQNGHLDFGTQNQSQNSQNIPKPQITNPRNPK